MIRVLKSVFLLDQSVSEDKKLLLIIVNEDGETPSVWLGNKDEILETIKSECMYEMWVENNSTEDDISDASYLEWIAIGGDFGGTVDVFLLP